VVSTVVVLAIVLAGCGATPPTQAGTAVPSAPPISAAPSAAASRAAPASPGAAPETAAIAAFVKLVTKTGFSYQVTFKGLSRHTTTKLPVKGAIAVSGRDYRVTADFTFENGTTGVEHRYVGGKAWVRFTGDTWRRLTGFMPAASMSPFASVAGVEAVRFSGTKKADGRTLYVVQIASLPVSPILIPATNLSAETVTRSVLDLAIDDAGRPVSGTVSTTGTGRVSGQLQEIVIELDLTFTKIGQKVTISAP
jgi:hypothetical protein